MQLSQSAIEAGWKALIEGPPQQIPIKILRRVWPVWPSMARVFGNSSYCRNCMRWRCYSLRSMYGFLAIGFVRALITEYAWQRRLSSRQQLLSSLFRDSRVLARRACAGFAAQHRSATRRMETRRTSPNMIAATAQPPTRCVSFALPLFGVHNRTGEGYLWSDSDEIE